MPLFNWFNRVKEKQIPEKEKQIPEKKPIEKEAEAEYHEDLYSADYKGERKTEKSVSRREWTNVSAIEEKIDRLSGIRRKGSAKPSNLEEKVDRLLSKKFRK